MAVGEQTAPEAREPGALENVVRESGCREEMGDVVFVGKMSNSPAGWREHFVFKGVYDGYFTKPFFIFSSAMTLEMSCFVGVSVYLLLLKNKQTNKQ